MPGTWMGPCRRSPARQWTRTSVGASRFTRRLNFVIGDRVHIPLGVVSIRPTATYAGVCGGGNPPAIGKLDVHRLLMDQPAQARRAHEARIRFRLAGPVANRLWFPESGYRRTPQPIEPPTPPDLSPAAAAELSHLEGVGNGSEPGAFTQDEDAALHYSFVLVGTDLSLPYFAWSEAETKAMVVEGSHSITRLAEALMDRHALSAPNARAVIREKAA